MNNRKRVIISFLVVIALYEGTVNLLYPMCGMGKSTMRGAMWIPFQQTARYVQNYSDEITDEERESINSVLDIDVIGEAYNPIVGDPVMNTYKWDDSKLPSYLITWGKMFFKHPGVYFAAAINQEYGYYAPIETNIEPKIEGDQFSELFVYLYEVGVRRTASDKSIELLRNLRDFNTNIPILKHLVEPGFYTWLMIIASFILLKFKKKAEFIILVPGYMTLFVCLISPLHNAIRYELPVAAIAPFFVGIALLANKKE